MRNVNLNFLPHPKTTETLLQLLARGIFILKTSGLDSANTSVPRDQFPKSYEAYAKHEREGSPKNSLVISTPSQNTIFYIRHEVRANTLPECPIKSEAKTVFTSQNAFH